MLSFALALLTAALLGISTGASGQTLCLEGCPKGAPASNVPIERPIYVLSNNATTKLADWVAYRITAATIGRTTTRDYKADPDLAPTVTLEEADYTGANAALKVDHGHQTPLASFTGTPYWELTNYLSNITPQKADLNQGPWERLESRERALAQTDGVVAVYVMTGPLYEHQMPKLPRADEPHVIPSGYWKIVAVETPNGIAAAAFVMHQDTARRANFCNYAVPIRDIESRTGFDFFSGLGSRQEEDLETRPGALVSRLGCTIINDALGVRIIPAA